MDLKKQPNSISVKDVKIKYWLPTKNGILILKCHSEEDLEKLKLTFAEASLEGYLINERESAKKRKNRHLFKCLIKYYKVK